MDRGGPVDLVTGGAGFIGTHLTSQLRAAGRTVRVLDLVDPPAAADQFVRGSITDADTVAEAVRGADRVFHVAGTPSLWSADAERFDRLNRAAAEQVMDAAMAAGVRAFVLTSSHAVDVRGTLPGPYTRAKLAAEQAALQRAAAGQPIYVVRPTLPIGPGDRNLTPPMRMLADFLSGRVPAYLEFETNLIDVRDVAEGHIRVTERGMTGHPYVLGGHNLMMSALLQMLQQASGRRMPRWRVPHGVALMAGHISERIARVTGREPKASLEGVRLAGGLNPVDPDALAPLGITPRPLYQTMQAACTWLIRSGRAGAGGDK